MIKKTTGVGNKHLATKNRKKDENALKKLEFLVVIVNRKKYDFYSDYIQNFEVNVQMLAHGSGTSDRMTSNVLGKLGTDKAIIFAIIKEERVNEAIAGLEEKFATIKDSKGVAFTVPIKSVIGALTYTFLSNNRGGKVL